ncbi:hypothetical protein [Salipiger sp.]|uniref:hypothetical protein n=1 Tax=Salipiger sp. TaxID=2078585 RepID=UPI003A97DEF6
MARRKLTEVFARRARLPHPGGGSHAWSVPTFDTPTNSAIHEESDICGDALGIRGSCGVQPVDGNAGEKSLLIESGALTSSGMTGSPAGAMVILCLAGSGARRAAASCGQARPSEALRLRRRRSPDASPLDLTARGR